jgi:hypothetical protein
MPKLDHNFENEALDEDVIFDKKLDRYSCGKVPNLEVRMT